VNGVGPADDGQLAGADGLAACRAHRQGVELVAAAVAEHDGLGPRRALLIAPLLQREDDGTQLLAGLGEVVLVALGPLGVGPSLDQSDFLEPAATA
jgi:hypothetical protein